MFDRKLYSIGRKVGFHYHLDEIPLLWSEVDLDIHTTEMSVSIAAGILEVAGNDISYCMDVVIPELRRVGDPPYETDTDLFLGIIGGSSFGWGRPGDRKVLERIITSVVAELRDRLSKM